MPRATITGTTFITLRSGKFADFVALGEDIFSVDADRIRHIPIERTIVGGRDIYVARP